MRPKALLLGYNQEHRDPDGSTVARLGVEHELRVWRDDEQVDFRLLIGDVAGNLRPLDPSDPRARRLPSGAALTADGWEAEIATPPMRLESGTPHRLDELLRAERTELRKLAARHGASALTGFSTHFNVSVPDHRVVQVAHAFVDTCLAALAAVVEPTDSHGMLVRPRRGRLEVGGEYVEGHDLVAGLTLLAACAQALVSGAVPPPVRPPRKAAAREKFGWYVDPTALHDHTALERVWAWARPFATGQGLDPAVVDDLLSGARPLRSSRRGAEAGRCTFATSSGTSVGRSQPPDTGPRDRPGVRAETEWLTWQHAVWVLRATDGQACRAVVPAEREPEFLRILDSGALDPMVRQMLRRRRPARLLVVNAQISGPGLWHDVRPGALVPAERQFDGSVPKVSARMARRALVRSRRRGAR